MLAVKKVRTPRLAKGGEARLPGGDDFVGGVAPLQGEPLPGLILLDLNMPRKDGREALKEIKADPTLRRIPVVVLTTSKAEEDILRSYDLGVNSYVTKPVTFKSLVELVKELGRYWFEVVELPPDEKGMT